MQNKDFTEMTESQTIVALNKEIQRKDELITALKEKLIYDRQQIQHLCWEKNMYPETQFNCNTCG